MDVGSRSITTTMPRLWPHSRVESIQRQNEACDPAAHSRLRPAIHAGALEWLFMHQSRHPSLIRGSSGWSGRGSSGDPTFCNRAISGTTGLSPPYFGSR